MRDELPRLRAAGWQVEFADDFRHRLLEVEAWDADLVEPENGWFDLDMGIIVEGERLPLAPLLAALFRRDGRWLDPRLLAQIADPEMIELVTPGNLRVRAPAWRLKPLAATLIDLFDGFPAATACVCRASMRRVWPNSTTAVAGSSGGRVMCWRSPSS
jgi:hypothetical protein